MKQFRAKHKDGLPDPGPVFSALPPSESNWLRDLHSMVNLGAQSHFTNDLSLNLNPCITTGASLSTDNSTRCGKSVFSSEFSSSTLQPSGGTAPSARKQITEDSRDDVSQNPQDLIAHRLHTLWQDISYVVSQHRTSTINLSTAAINVAHRLKDFVALLEGLTTAQPWSFSAYNNDDVRRILKMFLHLYDNLLQDDAFMKLKLMLCKAFNDFNASLKSFSRPFSDPDPGNILKPQNFAIGINNGQKLAHQDAITRIIAKIAGSDVGLSEQNGSFIAPITRGISKDMNVLCLYFGYSTLTDNHQRIVNSIQELYEDIHVIAAKNHIGVASDATASSGVKRKFQPDTCSIRLPFRVPTDPNRPPMSLSISVESSARVSGTMGGFIYPKIDLAKQPHMSSCANLSYAISCGHVCFDRYEFSEEYPHISSPLSVLIDLYKNALLRECQKLTSACGEDYETQAAYSSIYKQLDEMFPKKEVKVYDPKTRKELIEVKNLPEHRFGQITWCERKFIDASTKDGPAMVDKRLSDLAIIKVNKIFQCDQNYLGDDVPFSKYDPSLKFENLYVREVVSLKRNSQELPFEAVTEIDSVVDLPSLKNVDRTTDGLPVFKYGSTTKFTKGNLNGIKLVYWLDGLLHSSEFVVSSVENTTPLAAGGDSGSWILCKLEDVRGSPGTKGLGVVGMLHSNDGENREFGLFTPMMEILDRLEQVTNIQWGVIGVQEKSEESMAKTSDLSDSGSVYESGVEEQVSDID